MIIGLTGQAGVGKDTIAGILEKNHGFSRFAFADALRSVVVELADVLLLPGGDSATLRWALDGYGTLEEAKRADPRVRELLIRVGNGARESMGSSVWLDVIARRLEDVQDAVISDVSYDNEADFVWVLPQSRIVEVIRPGFDQDRIPVRRTFRPDSVIVNQGTIADLEDAVAYMVTAL